MVNIIIRKYRDIKGYFAEKVNIQVALKLIFRGLVEREFGNLLEIPDSHPKFIVTLNPFSGASGRNNGSATL
ncbi:MAG: hypothetical protein EA411_07315 [Saprospirales bacterium]|nr:MAG: hypothetical protein EA411_07315 [Saprospirales bacterium]